MRLLKFMPVVIVLGVASAVNDCEDPTPQLNIETNECQACTADFVYDATTNFCVSPLHCDDAFLISDDGTQCLPRCASRETWDGNACAPACGSREIIVGGNCYTSLVLQDIYNTAGMTSSLSTITAYDLNGDNRDDIFFALRDGRIKYFQNEGSIFVETKQAIVPNILDSDRMENSDDDHTFPKLAFGDVDGDGVDELVVGSQNGKLFFFKKIGGAYYEMTGDANILKNVNLGYYAMPTFGDIDGDGDTDLVVCSHGNPSHIHKFFNDGSGNFAEDDNALSISTSFPTPVLHDVDSDGDLDLLVGGKKIRYFENTNDGFTESLLFYKQEARSSTEYLTLAVGDFEGKGVKELVLRLRASDSSYDTFRFSFDNVGVSDKLSAVPENEISQEYAQRGASGQCS